MEEEIQKALKMLGYRDLSGKFAKPIGYNLFVFDPKTMVWANFFHNYKGEVFTWETEVFKDGDFHKWLIRNESCTRLEMSGKKDFGFLTNEEYYELLLNN